jgi:hypothetical protein
MQVVHVEELSDHHTLVFTVRTTAGLVRRVPITTCSLEASDKYSFGQLLFWCWMLYGKQHMVQAEAR